MNQMSFEELCRDASLLLGIDDTSALGQGFTVQAKEVLFEAHFMETRSSCLILAELGTIAPENRADVYEQLLALQLLSWDQQALRFGFNQARETAVFCVATGLTEQHDGAWLASLLEKIADQVVDWRTTLLAGKVKPPPQVQSLIDSWLEEITDDA